VEVAAAVDGERSIDPPLPFPLSLTLGADINPFDATPAACPSAAADDDDDDNDDDGGGWTITEEGCEIGNAR
jgi:hypothetical protein